MENKEIKENMLKIKEAVEEEQDEVKDIKYLKEADIIPQTEKYMGWRENSVYIVKKEDEENQDIYEIYNKNGELIATTDENGELIFEEEYLENLEQLMEEKFNGLVEFESLGIQEQDREIYLENILEGRELDLIEFDEDEFEFEEEIIEEEKEPEEFSETELQERGNGWEKYSNIIKVRPTDSIYDELEDLEEPLYIAYDKNGDFHAITEGEEGEPINSEVIRDARSTMQSVTHIDDTGKPVEKMVPSAVMDTYDSDLKISVKIGQYGYIEAQKLQRTHDDRYIATDIDRFGNRDKEFDVRYQTDETRQGDYGIDKLADNFEEREESGDENITLDEIDVNIERVKREIIDDALENYNDMSPQELRDYIHSELINALGEDDSHVEEYTNDVKETVEDEARFPQRGERNNN